MLFGRPERGFAPGFVVVMLRLLEIFDRERDRENVAALANPPSQLIFAACRFSWEGGLWITVDGW
jgi:hypothetical protein